MTPAETINAALAHRGIGHRFLCPGCGDMLDEDDRARADDWRHSDDLIAKFGEMPCVGCADTYTHCTMCEKLFDKDQADTIKYDGLLFCCKECAGEWGVSRDELHSAEDEIPDADWR